MSEDDDPEDYGGIMYMHRMALAGAYGVFNVALAERHEAMAAERGVSVLQILQEEEKKLDAFGAPSTTSYTKLPSEDTSPTIKTATPSNVGEKAFNEDDSVKNGKDDNSERKKSFDVEPPTKKVRTTQDNQIYDTNTSYGLEDKTSLDSNSRGAEVDYKKLVEELQATVVAQEKHIKELETKLKTSKPIDMVDLTSNEEPEKGTSQNDEKPRSQLAAFHEQAHAMAEVKKEALGRAAKAERKVEEIMLRIECPICFETKDKNTALGCGHVMCSDCSDEHARSACPTCRKQVEVRIALYK